MNELNNTRQQKKFKVLLIGDICIDEYIYGSATRLSPEAPVPIFVPKFKKMKKGMAANVDSNFLALGIDTLKIFGENSKKTRLIDVDSNQQLLRIDEDVISEPIEISYLPDESFDAIVFSDYNKGSVDYTLLESTKAKYNCPIFIDTKKTDLARFEGCFVKINNKEYASAKTYNEDLIVTRGPHGATYKNKNYTARQVEVADVCGAGDTFLASLVFCYLSTKDIDESIKFAIRASEVTVQHRGVYSPRLEEICV